MHVYNMLHSSIDMAKWTIEDILELLEENEVDSDDDMDCGPVVVGSDDEFTYMSEYEDSASDSEDIDVPPSMPGHQQTMLVAADIVIQMVHM